MFRYHKLIYAEDVLILNDANRDFSDYAAQGAGATCGATAGATCGARLFAIALPAGSPEVKRMETSREAIFDSVRRGFAAAYDALVLDPEMKVHGFG